MTAPARLPPPAAARAASASGRGGPRPAPRGGCGCPARRRCAEGGWTRRATGTGAARRRGRTAWPPTPEATRAGGARAAAPRCRPPPSARCASCAMPGASGPAARPALRAARRRRAAPLLSSSTAAALSSATWTGTTSRAGCSAGTRARTCSRWTTGWRPSTRSRRRRRRDAALRWAPAHAGELGADPARVARRWRQRRRQPRRRGLPARRARGGPLPGAQLLIYPPTDRTRRGRRAAFADGSSLPTDPDTFSATTRRTACPYDERHSPLRATDLPGCRRRWSSPRVRPAARRGRGVRRGAAGGRYPGAAGAFPAMGTASST